MLWFSQKYCGVFLETYCAVCVNVCLRLYLPCKFCSLPCHSWKGSGTAAEEMFLFSSGGWALPALPAALHGRERAGPARLSGSLVCRAMELHLLLSILFFCSPWFFFLSSESFWLWIYFRKSNKLSILSAYIAHEDKWWLCIYIVRNTFIHFNIARILSYLKVCFPFFQELCLSLK